MANPQFFCNRGPIKLGELARILESGVTLSSAVTSLGDAYRNMMLASTCGADSELIELPESQREAIGTLAERFSTPTLVHGIGVIQAAGRGLRGSSVARALVEATLVRLAEAEKFVDSDSLIRRIEDLTGSPPAGARGRKDLAARPRGGAGAGDPSSVSIPSAVADRRGGAAADGSSSVSSPSPPPAARAFGGISTAERTEILKDPLVTAVTGLFGGELVDVRRDSPPAEPPDAVENSDVAEGN